jgi:hypothetical protein
VALKMSNELKRILNEAAIVAYACYYRSICLEGLKKTAESSIRLAGVPAEIRTKHLQNTNLEHYLRAYLLVKNIITSV